MEALCLSTSSSCYSHYTTGSTTCEHWRQNKFGAVDEGHDYGERIRQLYEITEGHKP